VTAGRERVRLHKHPHLPQMADECVYSTLRSGEACRPPHGQPRQPRVDLDCGSGEGKRRHLGWFAWPYNSSIAALGCEGSNNTVVLKIIHLLHINILVCICLKSVNMINKILVF